MASDVSMAALFGVCVSLNATPFQNSYFLSRPVFIFYLKSEGHFKNSPFLSSEPEFTSNNEFLDNERGRTMKFFVRRNLIENSELW